MRAGERRRGTAKYSERGAACARPSGWEATRRWGHYRRCVKNAPSTLSETASQRELRSLGRTRVDLLRGQIRRRAVGEVLLADLGRDEHAVVRGECTEVVRALPADLRLC